MMYNLILDFPNHVKQGVLLANNFLPKPKEFSNVLVLGMGGSGIGGSIVSSLISSNCKVPITICKDYFIPAFVNENTLVIASSYSGNTEETISALGLAEQQGASVYCITSGGYIQKRAVERNYPKVLILGGNPPRSMLGYTLPILTNMLYKAGLLNVDLMPMFEEAANAVFEKQSSMKMEAALMAKALKEKIVVLYASSTYESINLRIRQQLNENAKMLCFHNSFPEMNHNEMVGWRNNQENIGVIMMTCNDDFERTAARINISSPIISEKAKSFINLQILGKNKVEKMLYLIHFGDLLSYYLAEERNMDAMDIREIDFLKNELLKI